MFKIFKPVFKALGNISKTSVLPCFRTKWSMVIIKRRRKQWFSMVAVGYCTLKRWFATWFKIFFSTLRKGGYHFLLFCTEITLCTRQTWVEIKQYFILYFMHKQFRIKLYLTSASSFFFCIIQLATSQNNDKDFLRLVPHPYFF